MRREPENTRRLCKLIHGTLAPLNMITELLISIPKHTEQQLLISLSNVARQIKLWIDEYADSDSDTDGAETTHDRGEYAVCEAEDHHCLTKIVTELVSLLAVHNRYVLHIAENILVVISEFLAASGSSYEKYIYLLGLCLELSTCHCLRTLESPTRLKESNSDLLASFIVLKRSLKSANWSTVAGVISVLHKILKHLKRECDDQLLKGYLDSVRNCLLNIPWDVFNELSLGGTYLGQDALVQNNLQNLTPLTLFSGNLVQFFCSLAAHGYASETSAACMDEQPVACIISNAMPKILAWCFSNKTQYLRHKILKLMMRLTYQTHLQCQVLVSWLNIISKYFQDLLAEPLTRVDNNLDDSLEGSPFLISFSRENKGISDRHLQRLAVFLFLRCSLSLVSQRDGVDEHCICANINLSLLSEQKRNHSCCNRKQGLLGLYQWLHGHFTQVIFVNNDDYTQKCASFSLSFLRLYMHEDDILFQVLLQLFTIPLSVKPVCEESKTPQKVEDEENMFCFISDILNPICLFHLFLAELLYDHQVLLDYLITKDTGASSAEYLLRCLRAVCDSWTFFVEFSWDEEVTIYRYSKKRKVSVDVLDFKGGEVPVQHENDDIPLSLPKRSMREDVYAIRQHRTTRLPFEDAMECLLSLKSSLLNLHRKKLFPYNPDVLLRRLTKFEELCFKQKNIQTSE
ncbi:uncharacterized protein LOC141662018 isoform X2 [Apium graveolens]|uniref:uncharacterized protein LOC141662018 isoform X2 n=1 Tax=Apium graveolens TaxID=4045 RepID=UPI003D794AA8